MNRMKPTHYCSFYALGKKVIPQKKRNITKHSKHNCKLILALCSLMMPWKNFNPCGHQVMQLPCLLKQLNENPLNSLRQTPKAKSPGLTQHLSCLFPCQKTFSL